jgi:nicotinamidase-related amidase
MHVSSLEKYQKYKTKYINLKNQLGGEERLKVKVLIVVDVQECFLAGTMGPGSDIINEYKSKILKFVEESKSIYDIIIFTKDNHPMNHNSFGIYHPHCIEEKAGKYCNKKGRDIKIRKLYDKSFMKNKLKTYDEYEKEDKENKTGKNLASDFEEKYRYNTKIQLKPDFLERTSMINDINRLTITNEDHMITNKSIKETSKMDKFIIKPYIIRINKGELCNFDAYGAFAYHVSYKEEEEKLQEIDIIHNPKLLCTSNPINWLNLSTGLAEFLIKKDYLKDKSTNIELDMDVCGLVTNICVVSTCVTGCKVFEALNFNNYKFKILNEYCMNLFDYKSTTRNAEKIIVDNWLTDKITISRLSDIKKFNPIEEYKTEILDRE